MPWGARGYPPGGSECIFMRIYAYFVHIYVYLCNMCAYSCNIYAYLCTHSLVLYIFMHIFVNVTHIYAYLCIFGQYLCIFMHMTQNSTKLHSGPSCCDQGSQKQNNRNMRFSIKVVNTLNPISIKNTETSTHIRMLYRNYPLARWRARRCAPLDICSIRYTQSVYMSLGASKK